MNWLTRGLSWKSVLRRELFLVALGVALLFALVPSQKDSFVSSETVFTDSSEQGLSIMTASCASHPHYAGDCTLDPDTNGPGTCRMTASVDGIVEGESVTLAWSTDNYQWGFASLPPSNGAVNPDVGPVDAVNGSAVVSPTITTRYVLSGTYNAPGGASIGTFECERTVRIRCPEGQDRVHGVCLPQCPGGLVRNEATLQCESGGTDYCPLDAGVQSTGPCPTGGCPIGFSATGPGGGCVFVGCPSGYAFDATSGLCVQSQAQCVPQPVCGIGATLNKVVNSCTGAQLDDCTTRGANWFCSGGQCIFVPQQNTGSGNISVNPPRVRSGEPTTVTWTSQGFGSCQVTEDNPSLNDAWSDTTGTEQSGPITQRTRYTLRCDGMVVDVASVNIIPVFIEK